MVAAPAVERATPARQTGHRHQNALDGIRAAAAGLVLMTHVGSLTGYSMNGTPVSWVLARGDVGVPIFFTLSGLLLYRTWAMAAIAGGAAGKLTVYLRRRALRILPAYWAVVLIALPVFNAGPAHRLWSWLEYLLLLQNYDPHPFWAGTGAIGLAQMWSLVVEVSFYLVLPLLGAALTWLACRGAGGRQGGVAGAGRRARRLLAGIAVLAASSAGCGVLIYYPRPNFRFQSTLPPLMIWFCAGMAMAVLLAWAAADPRPGCAAGRIGRSVAASAGMCGLIAASAFAIACTPLAGPEFFGIPGLWVTELKTLLYALVAAALVAPIAFQPLLADRGAGMLSARLLGSRPARFLGRISYGIFLWQFLAAYAFFGLLDLRTVFEGGSYNGAEVAAIGIAVALLTVVFATAGYYLIERPAQHFRVTWLTSLGRWLVSPIQLAGPAAAEQPGPEPRGEPTSPA